MTICQKHLHYAQKFEKQAYDKVVKFRNYALSNKIWLNSKYIKIKYNGKLKTKFFGLFRQVYKVELPKK